MKRALVVVAVAVAGIALGVFAAHRGVDEWSGARLRAAVAFAALGWALWLRSRRRAGTPVELPVAHGVAAGLAVIAAAAWFDFGALPSGTALHRHDVFHYYVGSKYHRELGYTRLYACAAVAEAQDGGETAVRARDMRDLVTDHVVPAAAALDHPEECTSRFSPARWRSFRTDVANLHAGMSGAAWAETQTDHGYNPSPAWSALGGTVARVVPSTAAGLRALAGLDVVLMAGVVAVLGAAFGWRVAALALTLAGVQEPGKFTWLGFSMLRLDWFALLAVAVALLRRRRPGLAGAALGLAAVMRGFPALGIAGIVLAGVGTPSFARFATLRRRAVVGFAAAVAVGCVLGAAAAGPGAWTEWTSHIRRHAAAQASNKVGLGVIVAFDPALRVERVQAAMPGASAETWMQAWADGARSAHERSTLPRRALQLAVAALWLAALRRARRPWIGLVLALLAAPLATDLSGYYLVYFVLAACLAGARGGVERALLGFAAGVEVLMVMPAVAWFYDDRFLAISVAYLGLAVGLAIAFATRPRRV